jgi:hypothetical protein
MPMFNTVNNAHNCPQNNTLKCQKVTEIVGLYVETQHSNQQEKVVEQTDYLV